jgi:hypothetical protein
MPNRRPDIVHRRLRQCAGVAAAALVWPLIFAASPARAAAVDLYYERAVMTAADQQCRLFSPDLGSALQSAAAQARGAALRSGLSTAVVTAVGQRARAKVAGIACSSPDIAKAADRVRAAFGGYSRLDKMNFPGDVNDWLAVRATSRREPIWLLSQTARFGGNNLVFGLAGRDQGSALVVAASFADGAQPYAARLVLRDPALAPEPFINLIKVSANGKAPLTARMPPRSATRSVLAEARSAADPSLLPQGATTGVAFRFPKTAADAMAQLDPREAVAVEFQFVVGDSEQVRTAYLEIGDFAAGRAFLAAAQR